MEEITYMTGTIKNLSVNKIIKLLDVMGLRSKGSANGINKRDLYKLNPLTKLRVIVYDREIVILDNLNQENLSTLIFAGCPG